MFNKLTFPHVQIGLRFLNVTKDGSVRKAALARLFWNLMREKGGERNPDRGLVMNSPSCSTKGVSPHSLILSGKDAENRFSGGELSEEVYTCLPCREGCSVCTDDTPCYAQEDKYLRLAIISFQTLCMLLDFISMLVVYHFRKAKVNPRVLLWCSCSLCGAHLFISGVQLPIWRVSFSGKELSSRGGWDFQNRNVFLNCLCSFGEKIKKAE